MTCTHLALWSNTHQNPHVFSPTQGRFINLFITATLAFLIENKIKQHQQVIFANWYCRVRYIERLVKRIGQSYIVFIYFSIAAAL